MAPALVSILSFVTGMVTTLFVGLAVPSILKPTDPDVLEPPAGVPVERWHKMTDIGEAARAPIRLLGALEQLLFFASFWLHAWELAGGWLVFKLGSKWEAWQAIVKVPEQPPEGIDPLEWVGAKNRWASQTLQRWLLGVLLNTLVAFLGFAAAAGVRALLG